MQRDARGRHWQTPQQAAGAGDVAECRDATGDHVLNLFGGHRGTGHGVLDGVAQDGHVGGVVEAAAVGLGQARAGV